MYRYTKCSALKVATSSLTGLRRRHSFHTALTSCHFNHRCWWTKEAPLRPPAGRNMSTGANKVGLFTIKGLQKPSDFVRLASEAMNTCDSLRKTLASQLEASPPVTKSNASETLFVLDAISKHVCNVIDAAELCRCVHSSEHWRDSASSAFTILSDYMGQLNADTSLYQSLDRVTESTVFDELTQEQQRFATLLKEEFVRDGIHLPDEERNKVMQLQSHVVQLETMFQQNINKSQKFFDVDASLVQDMIPASTIAEHIPQSETTPPGMVTLAVDSDIANALSQYSSNARLRKEIYMESTTSCTENLDVLESLRRARHELAVVQGFDSYSARWLSDKMAQTPQNVQTFLDNLQERVKVPYRRDLETIKEAKRTIEGGGDVEPWDIPFYTGLIKVQRGLDTSGLSSYFTISQCIEGMQLLVKQLFGIQMTEESMVDGERWDHGVSPQDRVRKFQFRTQEGEELGTMYLDLHPRNSKYGHAAHFTVLCGCAETVDGDMFQKPIIALVCNVSTKAISHAEVETMFHEFGHSLHSLLSRTTFQHLSGTRAAMDFVETPSHLLEHYCWDPQFLRVIARQGNEVIPDDAIKVLLETRNEFKSIDIQRQVLFSRLDQALFGKPIDALSSDIFESISQQNNIPYAPGTYWHTRFGHLVSYGAGYYSYLFAQAFSTDIWKTCLERDSMSREAGTLLWKELLGHGGARDPNAMLGTILGREPSVEAMVEDILPVELAKKQS